MNNLFSINSPIVFGTLLLLVLLSVVTWSIALLKLWRIMDYICGKRLQPILPELGDLAGR